MALVLGRLRSWWLTKGILDQGQTQLPTEEGYKDIEAVLQ